ncbi:hypothetical protein M011DRAFT_472763 [Sporormia fimetaria CBS 119925]|uniref:Uncharacterized protein n=1 Tax=Sporormia fimetaria CBS 119925 TaxID=1340428 RepID=A0A6A6UWG6_9PLEO|nr:hypothetical protein M011DRAFT_472763 [Sporormia fimetaria CBS 119925]
MPQNGFMGPGQGARMARRMNQSMGAPQNGSMLQGNQGAQMAGVRNQGLQDLGTLPNGSLGAGDQGSQMVGNEGAQMAGLMDLGPKPPQNGFLLPSNQGNQENKETQSDEQRRTKRQNTGTNK